MKGILKLSLLCSLVLTLASCGGSRMQETSEKTGWDYNRPKKGFFNAQTYYEGKIPVGMVYVPVNSFVKGNNSDQLSLQSNSLKKRVAVSGFFMDVYEATNLNWREYVDWMSQVYRFFPLKVVKVLPDETVWRSELSYNEPYSQNYYNHVAFSYYPVVGVSWEQAENFCKWRTDRINELELVNNGIIAFKPLNVVAQELKANPKAAKNAIFTTVHARDYIANMYKPRGGEEEEVAEEEGEDDEYSDDEYSDDEYSDDEYGDDEYGEEDEEEEEVTEEENDIVEDFYASLRLNNSFSNDGDDIVTTKEWNDAIDGVLYDGMCRLPTEAEWEFAAYGMQPEESGLFNETKSYPWGGSQVRHFDDGGDMTNFYANFMRGRGDLIGLSVNNTLTVPVSYFRPNNYGIYNMAGNVNEWVKDVYRASQDNNDEVNTYRGNEFENDSAYAESVLLKYFPDLDSIKPTERDSMRNMLLKDNKIAFKGGDFRNFKDGDKSSSIADKVLQYNDATGIEKANMISETDRVYKGGSWRDRAVWLNPGQRRHMDQAKCTNDIGFRCVMSIVGGKEHMRQ